MFLINPFVFGDSTPGGTEDVLLAEDDTSFLAEDGDHIVLEEGD